MKIVALSFALLLQNTIGITTKYRTRLNIDAKV